MTERRIKFHNTLLDKFFENVLLNMPKERLRLFTPQERLYMYKKRPALVRNSSLQEKIHYMARAGVQTVVVMYDTSVHTDARNFGKLLKILNDKTVMNITEAKEQINQEGVFFLTDSDIVASMNILSVTYEESKLFATLREYSKLNTRMYKLHKKLHADVQEELTASNDLNKLILNVWDAAKDQEGFESKTGLDHHQFKALALMAKKKIVIAQDLKEATGLMTVTVLIKKLSDKGLIESRLVRDSNDPRSDIRKYVMTGLGQASLFAAQKHLLQGIY